MRYKRALQRNSLIRTIFTGYQCYFLDERRKTLKCYCIKSLTKRIYLAMHIITLFFSNRLVTFATV